jgi:hypothetical protein
MTRVLSSFRQIACTSALAVIAGIFTLGATASDARADDFAVDNSMLLDPYDPVPQIRFSDYGCYDSCGYRHCWHECGNYRHCWHDCRDGYRGLDADEMNRAWFERLHRFDKEADHWEHDDHEWHDAMRDWQGDEWRLDHDHWFHWEDHDWQEDGYHDHWHGGDHHGDHHDDHHDDGHHDHP